MNLVDGDRLNSGLVFGSSLYAKNHTSIVITSKLVDFKNNISENANLNIEQIKIPNSVFAYTAKIFEIDTYSFEYCWSIKNYDFLKDTGLLSDSSYSSMKDKIFFEEDFEHVMDAFLSRAKEISGEETLNRFVAILMLTNYVSTDLALEYTLDDSFTDEHIMFLSNKVALINEPFYNNDDCRYFIEASKLPKIYSEKLLNK